MTDPRISQYYDLLEKARDYMYAQLCFKLEKWWFQISLGIDFICATINKVDDIE